MPSLRTNFVYLGSATQRNDKNLANSVTAMDIWTEERIRNQKVSMAL